MKGCVSEKIFARNVQIFPSFVCFKQQSVIYYEQIYELLNDIFIIKNCENMNITMNWIFLEWGISCQQEIINYDDSLI